MRKKKIDPFVISLGVVICLVFISIIYLFANRDSVEFLPDSVTEFFGRKFEQKDEGGNRKLKNPGKRERLEVTKTPTRDKMPKVKHKR